MTPTCCHCCPEAAKIIIGVYPLFPLTQAMRMWLFSSSQCPAKGERACAVTGTSGGKTGSIGITCIRVSAIKSSWSDFIKRTAAE